MKISIETLAVSICSKIIYNGFNDQLTLKHKKPTAKLQTGSDLNCWKALTTDSAQILNKYLFMLVICITHLFSIKYF